MAECIDSGVIFFFVFFSSYNFSLSFFFFTFLTMPRDTLCLDTRLITYLILCHYPYNPIRRNNRAIQESTGVKAKVFQVITKYIISLTTID